MAAVLDRTAMVEGLAGAIALLPAARDLGRRLAPGIDRVVMVAAGSANRAMLGLQYWIERESAGLEVRRYFPAELMAQNPRRLGLMTAYLGCLGTDAGGDLIAAALADEGVDVSHVRRIKGANARARIVHNHGERWSDAVFARVLPHIDIAFLSAPGRDDAEVAAVLRGCAAAGVSLAVATRGALGAMALCAGEILSQGIAPATIVDTLGAGDGFIAACLTSLLRGAELAAALEAGAGYAAMVCGWQGAFGHGAPWADGVCG